MFIFSLSKYLTMFFLVDQNNKNINSTSFDSTNTMHQMLE